MMQFDLRRILPRFLLEDKNGYAMAKAIEAGLVKFLSAAKDGLDTLSNVEIMPEWRLDELAWEYNIVYDYDAEIDTKREWIRDAIALTRQIGTKTGIEKFMKAKFQEATVQEWWEYDGEPYHFQVSVAGESSAENIAWCRLVLSKIKNVRSALDKVEYNGGISDIGLYTGIVTSCVTISTESRMIQQG